MRNKLGNILWGIFFIVLGIGLAGNALNLWQFTLFFDGWWTLFIIIPCLISIVQNGFHFGNIAGLLCGILLFVSAQDLINGVMIRNLIVPIILLLLGIRILFRDFFYKRFQKNQFDHNTYEGFEIAKNYNNDGIRDYTAIFAGKEEHFSNEYFYGATVNAIFGGIDLDLRNAMIDRDVVINATCVFGGIDLVVPSNVKVKVMSTPIVGGVDNRAVSNNDENAHTLYINATCVFGGVDIK